MELLFNIENLNKFPVVPGVYLMKNAAGQVLYVGKAKNLRQRVRQYFAVNGDGRSMVPYLIVQVTHIDTIVVKSEMEALLLENTLIKQHKPKYNALLKDDKTYIAIALHDEVSWPYLKIVRYKTKPKDKAQYFGPYTSAFAARSTFELLQTLFPLRQCSDAEFARRTRPCMLYGIKRCCAPCVQKCTPEQYEEYVKRTAAFLKGKDREIVRELQSEMLKAADALEFEQAAAIQRKIQQIQRTVQQQHVDMPQGGDANIIGLYREAGEVTICEMIVRGGKLTGSRAFHFSNNIQDNEEILESFLIQHYDANANPAKEILISEKIEDIQALNEVLTQTHGYKIEVFFPQKGDKKSLTDLSKLNAANAFKQERDASVQREKLLLSLQEELKLRRFPQRIECFDNSHLGGTELVSVMVAYTNGAKDSKRYRTYKSKADAGDDYGAMREVLLRRYTKGKEENDLPDLVLIDGGKGHLNVALKVFEELNIINVDVIGIAKDESRHDKGLSSEQIFLPNVKDPVILRRNSPVLFLLQEMRDEAHRFAINFQKKQRSKKLVRSSLDAIKGIGPAKKKALLIHFGSVTAIKTASKEQLTEVPGISNAIAEVILHHFYPENG